MLSIAPVERGVWLVCAITSSGQGDPNAISLDQSDFAIGGLKHHSFVRPLKLFTVPEQRFRNSAGRIAETAFNRIIDSIIALLRA